MAGYHGAMHFLHRIVFGAALMLASATAAHAQSVDVLDSDFVVETLDGHGKALRTSSRHVPLMPGKSCYQWLLKVKPTDGVVVRNLKYVALDGIWAVPILVVLCLCWNH